MLKAEKRINIRLRDPFWFHLTWIKDEGEFVPQMFHANPDGVDTIAKSRPQEAENLLAEIENGINKERQEYLKLCQAKEAWK